MLLGSCLVIEEAVAEGHDAAASWLEHSEDLREDLLRLHSMARLLIGKPAALSSYRHCYTAHAQHNVSVQHSVTSAQPTRCMRQDSHLHVSISPATAALMLCPAWLPAADHKAAGNLFAGAHHVTEHSHLLQILDADAAERSIHAFVFQSPSCGVLVQVPHKETVHLLVARKLNSRACFFACLSTAAKHARSTTFLHVLVRQAGYCCMFGKRDAHLCCIHAMPHYSLVLLLRRQMADPAASSDPGQLHPLECAHGTIDSPAGQCRAC